MKQLRWETDRRYYSARVYQDMLGAWIVEKVWGGLHNNLGHGKQEVLTSYLDAVGVMARIHKERRARNYGLVQSR